MIVITGHSHIMTDSHGWKNSETVEKFSLILAHHGSFQFSKYQRAQQTGHLIKISNPARQMLIYVTT